jgi:hypothetical protein
VRTQKAWGLFDHLVGTGEQRRRMTIAHWSALQILQACADAVAVRQILLCTLSVLPSVIVDTYNCELEDEDGFLGDKASKSAFHDILDRVRKASGEDPFGKKASEEPG